MHIGLQGSLLPGGPLASSPLGFFPLAPFHGLTDWSGNRVEFRERSRVVSHAWFENMGLSHPGIDVGPILTSAVNDLFPKKSALKRPLPIKKDACQTSHDFVIPFMHVNFPWYFLRCRDEVVLPALAYDCSWMVFIPPFGLAITPKTGSFGLPHANKLPVSSSQVSACIWCPPGGWIKLQEKALS